MSKAYQWPQCTVAECGHARTHKTEAKAQKMAKDKGKEFTTKSGDAVCVCHAHWTSAPDGFSGLAVADRPRAFFDCDAALGQAAPAYDRNETRAAIGEALAAEPEPEVRVAVPAEVAAPFDPRDPA